jgi:hypothetical protein
MTTKLKDFLASRISQPDEPQYEDPVELAIHGVKQMPIVRDAKPESSPPYILPPGAEDNYDKIVGGMMVKFNATYQGKDGVFRAVDHTNFGRGWTVECVDTHEHVDSRFLRNIHAFTA